MTHECKTLALLNGLGLHRGGCPNLKTCSGEICKLPASGELVEILSPDVETAEDLRQDEEYAEIFATKLRDPSFLPRRG